MDDHAHDFYDRNDYAARGTVKWTGERASSSLAFDVFHANDNGALSN